MRLVDLAGSGLPPIPLSEIGASPEIARDIQGQLAVAGLLDPPVDGKFGPVSQWALAQFLSKTGNKSSDGISSDGAAELLHNPDRAFRLNLGKDLASRVMAAMRRRGYWIARHPDCWNIVYVEGIDENGTANENAPNEFNDLRLLIRVDDDGRPVIGGTWVATTEPSRYWVQNPMVPAGAARIAFGQYKSWVVGTHHAGQPNAHEALVQADDVVVCRDLNKDFIRDGDKTDPGMFGINQHHGYDLPKENLGRSSAGCLVGRTKEGHKEFLRHVKKDARFSASKAYRFVTAVLPASAMSEKVFDPTTAH